MIVGNMLRFDPQFDLEAIYRGTEQWVNIGDFTSYSSYTCHDNYFYVFPNNTGALFFLFIVFKNASLFGITDFFCVAMVVNVIMVTATMVITSLICKRRMSPSAGLLAAALFLISPPFWFIAPVFIPTRFRWLFRHRHIICAMYQKIKTEF